MPTATKTRSKRPTAGPTDDEIAYAWVDRYLTAGYRLKTAEKEKADAKAAILKWLGPDISRVLPDGRTVVKTLVDFPAATIDRKAYTSTTVTVAPPPAP